MNRRLVDAVTALAARAFPLSRRSDGRVVRDCAREAVEAAGPRVLPRETLSIAVAGLRVRLRADARDIRHAPWRPALATLPLPLAAALLCVWTFGFIPRYDHWPLGEGWALLLGGSLLAVMGAALAARWVVVLGAGAVFVAAGAPYVRYGTEVELPGDTPSFFYAQGVDLGAASLIPALLLAGAALSLPPRIVFTYDDPPVAGRLPDPDVTFGDPYPYPWLSESGPLLTALGVALLVAGVFSWRAARARPEAALATALVLVSVAYPLAWRMHGYSVWPTILVPLGAALALTLRGAHAAHRSSSAMPA